MFFEMLGDLFGQGLGLKPRLSLLTSQPALLGQELEGKTGLTFLLVLAITFASTPWLVKLVKKKGVLGGDSAKRSR